MLSGWRLRPQVLLRGSHLLYLRSRTTADWNAPRFHLLGDFSHELDLQQTILECRAFDLDVVGEIKDPLERARRDPLVQVILIGRFRLASFNGEHVLFGRHRNFNRRETGQRQRYLVAVFRLPLDVIWRIVILPLGALRRIKEVEKMVVSDSGPRQGCKIISSHSQILLRARWIRADVGHRPAPVSQSSSLWRSRPPLQGQKST